MPPATRLKKLPVCFWIACICWCGFASAEPGPAGIDPNRYLEHVKYLASEELQGRGTGTPGLEKAATYIAGQLRKIGIQPAGGNSYYQEFTVTAGATLGAANHFEYSYKNDRHVLEVRQEFIPFNFSASGNFAGPVVFAGYGITALEYDYDDYAGVNVRDKFVLVLRHEPQEFDANSVFAGKMNTEHSQLFSKAANAKMHGARGVIFVNDTGNHGGNQGGLEEFTDAVGPGDAGIPFVHVKADVAGQWLALAGRDLADIQEEIDNDLRPRSFALPEGLHVRLLVDVRREVRTVANVAGYVPGAGPEYVIIGAHYDHLGLGELFSMAPSQEGTPHPGADDNASGVAGLLELARWFSSRPKPKRGILFLAFAGEELGLLGSSHYIRRPELPLEQAAAMINLDMIGRVRDGRVYVGGAGTGSTLQPMLEAMQPGGGLEMNFTDTADYSTSDHASFIARQVPVLFFFSGLHGDYHKPTDTWEKIDAPQTARLLDFIAAVVSRLAGDAQRPEFVKFPEPRGGRGRPAQ